MNTVPEDPAAGAAFLGEIVHLHLGNLIGQAQVVDPYPIDVRYLAIPINLCQFDTCFQGDLVHICEFSGWPIGDFE